MESSACASSPRHGPTKAPLSSPTQSPRSSAPIPKTTAASSSYAAVDGTNRASARGRALSAETVERQDVARRPERHSPSSVGEDGIPDAVGEHLTVARY